MDIGDTLLAYSEWLDGQGLMVAESAGDTRSHNDLAQEFIESWQGAPLPGLRSDG